MISLKLDPDGKKIFSLTQPTSNLTSQSVNMFETSDKLKEMTNRVKKLESELETYQV